MRRAVTAALCLSLAAAPISPVAAQTRLPRTSPSERQVQEINRNLQQEQRQLGTERQIQIDNNQLRQSIDRQRVFTNPAPPVGYGTCPAGSIGC